MTAKSMLLLILLLSALSFLILLKSRTAEGRNKVKEILMRVVALALILLAINLFQDWLMHKL